MAILYHNKVKNVKYTTGVVGGRYDGTMGQWDNGTMDKRDRVVNKRNRAVNKRDRLVFRGHWAMGQMPFCAVCLGGRIVGTGRLNPSSRPGGSGPPPAIGHDTGETMMATPDATAILTKYERAVAQHNKAAQAHANAADTNAARGKDSASQKAANNATANALEATLAAPANAQAREAAERAVTATTKRERVEAHEEARKAHEAAARVKLTPDHSRYENRPGETASGRSPYDIGDEAAEILRAPDLDGQYRMVAERLAQEAGTTPEEAEAELRARYGDKNLGMQRMNLGNRFRGWMKREAKRQAQES